MARPALRSWKKPSSPDNRMMTRMMIESTGSPSTHARTVAITRMMMIGLRNWRARSLASDVCLEVPRVFVPTRAKVATASAEVNPVVDEPRSLRRAAWSVFQ
jgi:hypothetical protein